MERVQVLIDRLNEQKNSGAPVAQLLVTAQLLQQELALLQQQQAPVASKKVSVILPAAPISFLPEEAAPPPAEAPVVKAPEIVAPQSMPKTEAPVTAAPSLQSYALRRPSITELMQEKGEQKEAPQTEVAPPALVHFDAAAETPTLLQHTPQAEKKIHREINQIIHGEQRSLNDNLKQERTEVAQLLQDSPIKDLRKGIGINDRFLFLNELFNGDETAYERSITTINAFHVLQEAEFWINRELKLRLGWNDTSETVQHFYTLVRRRFS